MIKYFYKNLHSNQARELDEPRAGTWVYAETPSEAELGELAKKFDLEQSFLEDALDEDEMPRLEKEGDKTYIFVRFVYKSDDGELGTAPLLFVFGASEIITVSLVRLPSLEAFFAGKVEFATTQRAKLVLQILRQIGEHYDGYISSASKQIKAIRTRLRGHTIGNQDFIDFVTLEDELNEFLSSLLPTNATLRRLLMGRYVPLFEDDQDIVEDLLLNNEQSVEACRSNMKSIRNIREAYTAISSNNLNRTIKLLTVATVILAIPTLIYSMYGMNVDLPGQHSPQAFTVIIIVTVVVLLLVALIGRRKRIF